MIRTNKIVIIRKALIVKLQKRFNESCSLPEVFNNPTPIGTNPIATELDINSKKMSGIESVARKMSDTYDDPYTYARHISLRKPNAFDMNAIAMTINVVIALRVKWL